MAEEVKTLKKIVEINEKENEEGDAEDQDEYIEVPIQVDVIYVENGDDPFDDQVIDSYLGWNSENEVNRVDPEEQIAEVIEIDINDDPNDEEVIEFYIQQEANRARRTSPMSEALKTKQHGCNLCKFVAKNKSQLDDHSKTKHKEKCNKCNFATETKLQLNLHQEAQHAQPPKQSHGGNHACTKCDFAAKSELQLKKHTKVRHGPIAEVCRFWENGCCDRLQCRFSHPEGQRRTQKSLNIPCRYQQFCRNPSCQFIHNVEQKQIVKCRYGTSCENTACRLDHRNIFLG